MGKGEKGSYRHKRRVQKLVCVCIAAILITITVALAYIYFTYFKPKDPKLQVPTMQLLSLYAAGFPGPITSVNLTLELQVSMYNPNRAPFLVQDGSTACLYFYGTQSGFTSVPAATIPAQSFITISIGLTVDGPSPLHGSNLLGDVASGILHVYTSVTTIGSVTTLHIFSHRSHVVSKCSVNISLDSRAIESYTCDRSFSIET